MSRGKSDPDKNAVVDSSPNAIQDFFRRSPSHIPKEIIVPSSAISSSTPECCIIEREIIVPVCGPGGGNQVGSICAGSTCASVGKVFFNDANGVSFGISGQTVTASVSLPQGGVDIAIDGNTSGTTALISSGTAIFAGGSNITLSQNGQSITIVGGAGGGNSLGLSAGSQSVSSGVIQFADSNGISFGMSGSSQITASYTVPTQSQQTQNLFDLSLDGNTSGVLALISSGTAILAGGNNITLSQNGQSVTISGPNTFSQTVQTQNLIDLSLSGNTAGALALISSGTAILAGGNNITLSQNGQSVTISGPTVSPETPFGISAGSQSVSTGTLVFSNSNNVTFGMFGSSIVTASASFPAQTTQTQNLFDLTLSGNTSGTLALVSSGTLTLAGGNNITLSQVGNAVTISGPNTVADTPFGISAGTQSVSTGTLKFADSNGISFGMSGSSQITASYTVPTQTVQTQNLIDLSLSGNTSGTLALISSGTAILAGGNNITLSQDGQSITISGANNPGQTVQTQNLFDLTLSGNTSGTLALVSSGTLTLAGGNNITLSQVGNAVTISGPTTVAQSVQTQNLIDLSLSGNTSGTLALISSGTAILAGGNNITLSQNGQSVTISAFNQTVQTQNLIDVTLSGNTSGTLALISSGTLTLAGGNNITLSQAGNAITVSAFNQTAESQSIGMSNIGNTSGTTGVASGAQVQFLLAGGNNVTLSQSLNGASGTITISAFNQTNQTVGLYMSSNTTSSVSSGTVDARSMTFRGVGIASVGYSNGEVILSVPTAAVGNNTFLLSDNIFNGIDTVSGSAIQLRFVPGINISLQNNSAGAGGTSDQLIIDGAAFQVGVSDIGNTSGTTGTFWETGFFRYRLILAGGNNITLSQSMATDSKSYGTITISAANQTNQTVGLYMSSNTTSSVSSGTVDARSMTFRGVGVASVGYSNGQVIISVPNAAAGTETIGMSNIGNTSGNTTPVTGSAVQVVFAGGNNVTLSQSTNGSSATITISAFNQTVQTQNCVDLSIAGNTSGTSTIISSGTAILAGGNNITLSQNGQTITISAFNQTNQTVGLYMSSNTTSSVSSGTVDARSMTFRGVGVASVGYSNGEVIISVPSGGGSLNLSAGTTSNNLTNVTFSNSNGVSFGLNSSTVTASVAGLLTWSSWNAYPGALSEFDTLHNASLMLQPYPMPTHQFDRVLIPIALSNATNSSGSHTISVWVGIYTQNISTLSLASSTSTNWAVTQSGTVGIYSSIGGVRLLTIGSTNTINAGQYFVGVVSRTTSGGANASISGCYRSQLNSSFSGIFSSNSNASMQPTPGFGVYSVTTAGMPNTIGFSELVGVSSDALRAPVIYFQSQTA